MLELILKWPICSQLIMTMHLCVSVTKSASGNFTSLWVEILFIGLADNDVCNMDSNLFSPSVECVTRHCLNLKVRLTSTEGRTTYIWSDRCNTKSCVWMDGIGVGNKVCDGIWCNIGKVGHACSSVIETNMRIKTWVGKIGMLRRNVKKRWNVIRHCGRLKTDNTCTIKTITSSIGMWTWNETMTLKLWKSEGKTLSISSWSLSIQAL